MKMITEEQLKELILKCYEKGFDNGMKPCQREEQKSPIREIGELIEHYMETL